MAWCFPGIFFQTPPEQHLGLWEWADRIAGLVVPFLTLLLALLVYLVYRRQAAIMDRQAETMRRQTEYLSSQARSSAEQANTTLIQAREAGVHMDKQASTMAEQTEIMRAQQQTMQAQAALARAQTDLQRLQADTNQLLALAGLAPIVVPGRAEAGSYPWTSQENRVILTNMGRGAAFDLRVSDWSLDEQGLPHALPGVAADSQFAEPSTDVFLTRNPESWRPKPGLLVLHYNDFSGETWHTTWNLSPDTGDYEERDCPAIWNPAKWQDKPAAWRFCQHCQSAPV